MFPLKVVPYSKLDYREVELSTRPTVDAKTLLTTLCDSNVALSVFFTKPSLIKIENKHNLIFHTSIRGNISETKDSNSTVEAELKVYHCFNAKLSAISSSDSHVIVLEDAKEKYQKYSAVAKSLSEGKAQALRLAMLLLQTAGDYIPKKISTKEATTFRKVPEKKIQPS